MHFVVHYAEIGLKGSNRPRFEERLARNLEQVLRPLGLRRVVRLYGRLLVELPADAALPAVSRAIGRVFGVAYFSRATRCKPTFDGIAEAVDELVDTVDFESFGVRSRRVDKSHPFTSDQLNRDLGTRIVKRTGKRVDLGQPDLWVEVHVLSDEALLLWQKIRGPGGLPVGSSGHAVSLISGGIDSPVASHHLQRRGLSLIYAHFHSAPYTSAASLEKVRDIVARLGAYQGPAELWTVAFGDLQQQLVREAPAGPRIVLYRRFMLRIAEAIAARCGALALVTGDSLGQVSSQTLGNLDTINRAATLPVLRPLIGRDKAEIVELAQRLGTYEISIEPDDDCCSFLMPRRPATWTRPEAIEAIERELDVAGMVEAAFERAERERIEPLDD